MGDHSHDDDKLKAQRREFLLQCGRFAVVTPPVVTLMLSVGDKGISTALASSPGKKSKTSTTTTTTTPTTTTEKTTTKETTTKTTTKKTTTRTTSRTTTVTKSVTTLPTTTATLTTSTKTLTQTSSELLGPGPKQDSSLAMMIDSLGLMKIT
jgi:hypothetical protein